MDHVDAHFKMRHGGPEGELKIPTLLKGKAVVWADVSRTQGSCWGRNITDVGLKKEGSEENMIMFSSENFNTQVYNMRASECGVVYPDKTGGLQACKLDEMLDHLHEAFPDHNLNAKSFSHVHRDQTCQVSFQVIFPRTDADGGCKFKLTAYDYADGLNLRLLQNASGASLSQAKRCQQVLGPDIWEGVGGVPGVGKWKQCPFEGKLTGRTFADAQTESEEEGGALRAQGIATLQQIGPPACGESSDVFMLVSIPVQPGHPAWLESAGTVTITTPRGVGYIEAATSKVYSKEQKGFIMPAVYQSNCCTTTFGVAFVQPDKRAFIPGVGFKTVDDSIGDGGPGIAVMTSSGLGWRQVHDQTVFVPGVGKVADPTAPPRPVYHPPPEPCYRGLAAAVDEAPSAAYRSMGAAGDGAEIPRYNACSAAAPDVDMADAMHMAVSVGAPTGDALGVSSMNLERNPEENIRVVITLVVGLVGGKKPSPESLDTVCKRIKKLEDNLKRTGGGAPLMESGTTVPATSAAAIAGNAQVAAAIASKTVPSAPTYAPRPVIRKATTAPFAARA